MTIEVIKRLGLTEIIVNLVKTKEADKINRVM